MVRTRPLPPAARALTLILGALVGGLIGFHLTLGLVVLKARFGYFIFAMHDLGEFRLDTLPVMLGIVVGGALGHRIPFRFLRSVLRGLGASIIGALTGAGIGWLAWRTPEGLWAGGIILSALALVVGTFLALRYARDGKFAVPDLAVGSFVVIASAFAVMIGLRDPEAVETPDVDPVPLPPPAAVDEVVFILGDAGATLEGRSPLLRALQYDIERWSETLSRDSAVSVLFPGDLVYPVGVRDRDHDGFPTDSVHLWNQINLLAGPAARRHSSMGMFQAGNHDWGNTSDESGFDRIANLDEQLSMARGSGIAVDLFPDAGRPGPAVRDVRDDVRFILLDTHWFLRTRSEGERSAFLEELREAILSAGDRHVILSAHHPFQSAGPHGAIVPGLHAWGVGYLLRRSGTLVQDLNSPVYDELLRGMREIFASVPQPPLLFIGGHDHSLQVLERQEETDPAYMLVSGAGSKITSIRTLPGMHYGAGRPGYMMLVLREDGALDLFVIAGAPELLKCTAEDEEALRTCMTQGENSYEIVYGQTLAEAPDRPVASDTLAAASREEREDPIPAGEVANTNAEEAAEPNVRTREFAWWSRDILSQDEPIAEAYEDIEVPPPAVPARMLYFQPDSVVSTTGASYSANILRRMVLGELNRHLWDVPFRLPVLDLDALGGGVEVVELTGGKQTVGVLLRGQDGREYQFRSIVKDASRALSEPLQGTAVDELLQDQMGAQFPLGAMIVAELLEAVDVLVAPPRPVVMPHHWRLGEYRPYFGGRIGWLEVRPDERGDDRPGFADSRKIVGGADIYEELAEDPGALVDETLYLRSRMIDFLVGDWDRHSDNWRWARFDEDSVRRWEPIPRDRDWAFARTGGLASELSGTFMPRYVGFDETIPPAERIASAGYRIDHRVLAGVPRARFLEEARYVERTITDAVIDSALSILPPEFQAIERPRLDESLRARRAQLETRAGEFYDVLSQTVHVYGYTGVVDTVRIERLDGDRVAVRVFSAGQSRRPHREYLVDTTLTARLHLLLEPDLDVVVEDEELGLSVTRVDPADIEESDKSGRDY